MTKTGVIIVAGGSGTRMGAGQPKQFLPVGGKEILVHTLEKFLSVLKDSALKNIETANINAGAAAGNVGEQAESGAEIVVVLPTEHIPSWNKIAARHSLENTHRVCAGGPNRFMSVRNGLEALGRCDIIAIHDGVRPLLSQELIVRCLKMAESEGSAIPVVEPADSFRILAGDHPSAMPVTAPAAPTAYMEGESSLIGPAAGFATGATGTGEAGIGATGTREAGTGEAAGVGGTIAKGGYPYMIDRSLLRAVQTPQVFRAEIIRSAYEKAYSDTIAAAELSCCPTGNYLAAAKPNSTEDPTETKPLLSPIDNASAEQLSSRFTDDASVAEYSGNRLSFCAGERRNIKITHPEDILFAEAVIGRQE